MIDRFQPIYHDKLQSTLRRTTFRPDPEGNIEDLQHTFRPISHVFHNLCIEEDTNGPYIRLDDKGTFTKMKKIVVYNSQIDGFRLLDTNTNPSTRDESPSTWPIHYTTQNIPDTSTLITSHPAYFVATSCLGNLYHFWHDITLGLYKLLKKSNRLGSVVKNQLYYRMPMIKYMEARCFTHTRYQDILFALSVRRFHDVYHAADNHVCYTNAVFGNIGSAGQREVVNYLLRFTNRSDEMCTPGTITIVQRVARKILNIEALVNAIKHIPNTHTQVVIFEHIPNMLEQLRIVRCTDLLIGVQGAGLQWAMFMRPNTALLELYWKYWKRIYSNILKGSNGMHTDALYATEVYLNWTSYRHRFNENPSEERKKELYKTPGVRWSNHWQIADGIFDPVQFSAKVRDLLKYVRKSDNR